MDGLHDWPMTEPKPPHCGNHDLCVPEQHFRELVGRLLHPRLPSALYRRRQRVVMSRRRRAELGLVPEPRPAARNNEQRAEP